MLNRDKTQWPEGTRNVQRTLAIIREVSRLQNKGGSLSKIARAVNIPIPTVKRILSVLVLEGFVTFNSKSKHYSLGYELHKMIRESIPVMLKEKYHNALKEIAEITEDTAYLVIRSDFNGLCIDEAKGSCSLGIPYGVGSLTPLGLIASGIALLAPMDDVKIHEILGKNKGHYVKYKMTREKIWRHIQTIRESGYVRCGSHIIEGLMNVALPISDESGTVVCSMVVSSTDMRLAPKRCSEIVRLIKEKTDP